MTNMIPDLEGYFRGLAPTSDALLLELEAEATRESIPIVGPVVGELLFVLARATGRRRTAGSIGVWRSHPIMLCAPGAV